MTIYIGVNVFSKTSDKTDGYNKKNHFIINQELYLIGCLCNRKVEFEFLILFWIPCRCWCLYLVMNKCRLCCWKQISRACISYHIPQETVWCNYLCIPYIPASVTKVSIYSHWKLKVFMLLTLLPLIIQRVVIMTASGEMSENKVGIKTPFSFQWYKKNCNSML